MTPEQRLSTQQFNSNFLQSSVNELPLFGNFSPGYALLDMTNYNRYGSTVAVGLRVMLTCTYSAPNCEVAEYKYLLCLEA